MKESGPLSLGDVHLIGLRLGQNEGFRPWAESNTQGQYGRRAQLSFRWEEMVSREPRYFRSQEVALWDSDGGGLQSERLSFYWRSVHRIKVERGEVSGQGLVKEMTIPKALGESCLCELSQGPCTRVLPGEGKETIVRM